MPDADLPNLQPAGSGRDTRPGASDHARLAGLIELTDLFRSAEGVADLSFAAGKALGESLKASRVGFGTIDADKETLHVEKDWTAPGVETLQGMTPMRDYGSFIDTLKAGRFVVIPDVRTDPRTASAAAALEGRAARSFVNVPVLEEDRLVAVLYVNSAFRRDWTDGELAFIREVAERTRTAVERARSEAALRASEARLRDLNAQLTDQVALRSAERDRLWELSQDMLARADYSGMMSAVSPAWKTILGWSEVELLSRGYATFMHPDDMPPTLEAIARMGETNAPTIFENRIATSDGGWKNIEWTVAPEPDGLNFIAVGRDVSAARSREAELTLAQDALRQSQKMEAMGQLTGGVAHDFNNLLTPIVGALDLLQHRETLGEREHRLIAGAAQSAERARTVVQRLLAFARRQPLRPVPVDVAGLMHGMAELLTSVTGPQIRVVVAVPEHLPFALADPNQVEMALLNLAVNARDAMPAGGDLTLAASAEIVRGRPDLKPGEYLKISVVDTGVGMDAATAARAIEPFFSTKGIGQGTGLGLSMVHGLALQLGGGLTIDSRPGHGTTITLWLPQTDARPESSDAAFDVKALAPLARGTALLVDDEDAVRLSTADMLGDLGYTVSEASSGDEALRLIEAGAQFDLVVTDHLMPGMSGVDLARAVRRRAAVPVLIISGYAEVEGIAADLPRLAKPFRRDQLARSLAQLAG